MDQRGVFQEMNECPRCGLKISDSEATACPNCGQTLPPRLQHPSTFRDEGNFVERFFRRLKFLLTEPSRFFREMPLDGDIGGPIAFGLVAHWIGSAFGFAWLISANRLFSGIIERMTNFGSGYDNPFAKSYTTLFQGGFTLADPFLTLIGIFVWSAVLWVSCRILMGEAKVSYRAIVRIIAYSLSAAIIALVPMLGPLAGRIYTVVLIVIGVREVFHVTTGRAVLAYFFPILLILAIIMMMVGLGLTVGLMTVFKGMSG